MSTLQLQFRDSNLTDQAVAVTEAGLRLSGEPDQGGQGLRLIDDEAAPATIKLTADTLGCWLHVYAGRNAVHLNGRPVHRLAWTRPGDRLFIDGQSAYLTGEAAGREPEPDSATDMTLPSFALRGLSGDYYGQAIPVTSPVSIGSHPQADVRVGMQAGVAAELATAEPTANGLRIRAAANVESRINGLLRPEAILEAGDQWQLAGKHRFVLESPDFVVLHRPEEWDAELELQRLDALEYERQQAQRKLVVRLAWLVGSCALISALVTALILYAPR